MAGQINIRYLLRMRWGGHCNPTLAVASAPIYPQVPAQVSADGINLIWINGARGAPSTESGWVYGGHTVEERRSAHRVSKTATGQILFGSAVIHCAILDLSDRGARLEFSTTKELPLDFVLKLTEGNRRQCKVVWRAEDQIGVVFC